MALNMYFMPCRKASLCTGRVNEDSLFSFNIVAQTLSKYLRTVRNCNRLIIDLCVNSKSIGLYNYGLSRPSVGSSGYCQLLNFSDHIFLHATSTLFIKTSL